MEEELHKIEEGTLQELGTSIGEEDNEELNLQIEDVIVQHEIAYKSAMRILRVPSSEVEKVLVEKL